MAKEAKANFEIPDEMRNLAEQSVEQAKRAFDAVITAAHHTVTNLEDRAAAAQAGAKDMSQKAVAFTKGNVEASFDFAQKIVRAKNVDEMMRLQAEYVRVQLETLADQASQLGQAATKSKPCAIAGRNVRKRTQVQPMRGNNTN